MKNKHYVIVSSIIFSTTSSLSFGADAWPLPPSKLFVKASNIQTKVTDRIEEKLVTPDADMREFAEEVSSRDTGLNHPDFRQRERVYREIEKQLKDFKKAAPQNEAYYTLLDKLQYAHQQSAEVHAQADIERLLSEYGESIERSLQRIACELLEQWKADPIVKETVGRTRRLLDGLAQSPGVRKIWSNPEAESLLDPGLQEFLAKQGLKNVRSFTLGESLLKEAMGFSDYQPLSYEATFPGSGQPTKVHISRREISVMVETPRSDVSVPGFNDQVFGRFRFEQAPDFLTPVYSVAGTFWENNLNYDVFMEPGLFMSFDQETPKGKKRAMAYYDFKAALAGYFFETMPRSILKLKSGKDFDEEALKFIHGALSDLPCMTEMNNVFRYRPGEWRRAEADKH